MNFTILCAIVFFALILTNNFSNDKRGKLLKYVTISMFLFSLFTLADQAGILNELVPKELDQAISWVTSQLNSVKQMKS